MGSPKMYGKTIFVTIAILIVFACVLYFLKIRRNENRSERTKRAIAVLPFSKETNFGSYDYFTDGVTEHLIDMLSLDSGITVISRNSITQYKETRKSIKEIGSELNVEVILCGTIQRYDDRIKIGATLYKVASGEKLWSNSYDHSLNQVFDLQREIVNNVFRVMNIYLNPFEQNSPVYKSTKNLIAYDYYLKARDYYYRFTPDDNAKAIKYFQSALVIDSGYVEAMAGLSDAYSQNVAKFGYSNTWLDSAITMSEKAISIDSGVAEAYKAEALAFSGKGWHTKSIEMYLTAVQLNPNYFTAVGNLGAEYAFLGKYDKSLVWFKRSLPLNPGFPFSIYTIGSTYSNLYDYATAEEWFKKVTEIQPDFQYVKSGYAIMYLRQGDYQHALQEIQTVLSAYPNDLEALTYAAWSHLLLQHYEEAAEYFKKAITIDSLGTFWYGIGKSSTTALGFIYTKLGNQDLARKMFNRSRGNDQLQLEKQSEWHTIRYDLAAIDANEGNKVEALQWLRKAKDLGWRDYQLSLRDPLLGSLHGDPEFEQLINELQELNREMFKIVNEIERR